MRVIFVPANLSNNHAILLVQVYVVEESLRDLQHRVDVFNLSRVALVCHVDQRHLETKYQLSH